VSYVLRHLLTMAYVPTEIFNSWCPKNDCRNSDVMLSEGEAEAQQDSIAHFPPFQTWIEL